MHQKRNRTDLSVESVLQGGDAATAADDRSHAGVGVVAQHARDIRAGRAEDGRGVRSELAGGHSD